MLQNVTQEVHRKSLLKNLNGRDLSEDLEVHGKIILECILKEQCWKLRTEFI